MFQHLLKLEAVKGGFRVPVELRGSFHAFQTVKDGHWEVIWTNASIPKGSQLSKIALTQGALDLIYRPFLTDQQVAAHQKSTVCLMLKTLATLVHDLNILTQSAVDLVDKLVNVI